MKYGRVVKGIFQSRPNRFIAKVRLDETGGKNGQNGRLETVHVKNTGRCKELLIPGVSVMLQCSDNPARKTGYDLISVYKEGLGWVNIDSQAPNQVVKEWLLSGQGVEVFPDLKTVHPEYTYGDSRLDFYLEYEDRRALMEVKGVTLEREGIGYFPDAPTQRGVKHLEELARGVQEGYQGFLAFVIQMPGIRKVLPNIETHPEFGAALDRARSAGVQILFLECEVTEDALAIKGVHRE